MGRRKTRPLTPDRLSALGSLTHVVDIGRPRCKGGFIGRKISRRAPTNSGRYCDGHVCLGLQRALRIIPVVFTVPALLYLSTRGRHTRHYTQPDGSDRQQQRSLHVFFRVDSRNRNLPSLLHGTHDTNLAFPVLQGSSQKNARPSSPSVGMFARFTGSCPVFVSLLTYEVSCSPLPTQDSSKYDTRRDSTMPVLASLLT